MMIFPLNLSVGAAQPVNQIGSYVYYSYGSAGGANAAIKVKTDLGDEFVLLPGQGFNTGNRTYSSLQVTNQGGEATIIGQLLLADGSFFDNRVTGSVEVVDGGMARTLGDVAYMGESGSGAAAAKYSSVQLWNPSTTKVVIVKRIIASSGAGGSLFISPGTVMAANFAKNCQSKRVGSANLSAAALRNEQVAAQYATRYFGQNIGASAVQDVKVEEPFALLPGTGLNVWGSLNQDINCTFEFYERSISA